MNTSPYDTLIENSQKRLALFPERRYHRIGDVAKCLDVETHVLRYWETQFSQIKPQKSGTGHRLYRKKDVETLVLIRELLYSERYTIVGAKRLLKEGDVFTLLHSANLQEKLQQEEHLENEIVLSKETHKAEDTLNIAAKEIVSENTTKPKTTYVTRQVNVAPEAYTHFLNSMHAELTLVLDDVRDVMTSLQNLGVS
jgi:DNA-binding transcriptional MerR regulator